MQSRLASIVAKNARLVNYAGQVRSVRQGYATIGRIVDPRVDSGDPEGENVDPAARAATASEPPPRTPASQETDPFVAPKPPLSSPKLESNPVSPAPNPSSQQKRRFSEGEKRKQREEDVEYFKHHKASPLSNLEIADTRKPISRATDSIAESKVGGYGGGGRSDGVIVWLPEQLESAEETMERVTRIWMENKMKGDPNSPHGRVLRELRGEL